MFYIFYFDDNITDNIKVYKKVNRILKQIDELSLEQIKKKNNLTIGYMKHFEQYLLYLSPLENFVTVETNTSVGTFVKGIIFLKM